MKVLFMTTLALIFSVSAQATSLKLASWDLDYQDYDHQEAEFKFKKGNYNSVAYVLVQFTETSMDYEENDDVDSWEVNVSGYSSDLGGKYSLKLDDSAYNYAEQEGVRYIEVDIPNADAITCAKIVRERPFLGLFKTDVIKPTGNCEFRWEKKMVQDTDHLGLKKDKTVTELYLDLY